ncbi:glycoside hydrolase family 3 C-terminal domain-containing protein [Archangium gephyra]|uniref:glycoside hydrolase family 3 C-terminal domain-containing protein n=1 Tax=Archangium gephyra TaxID=48 RepID=UPI003B7B1D80
MRRETKEPQEDVAAKLAAMTLEEKVALCAGRDLWTLGGVPRLGVPPIVLTDGPHGVRLMKGDPGQAANLATSEPATCFPTASSLAATWDVALLEEVGVALGEEARAMGVSVLLGPGANIKRTPLCGRDFEYFSEDPLLSSRMAGAWIRGVQRTGVAASLKHFAANNQEERRTYIDARVDARALREIYLASFEHAVTEARPWTVMAAYNRLEGTYCAQHPWLLTGVLREEWGFDGVVVSDWGAIDVRAESLVAGCDLEMPGSLGRGDTALLRDVRSGRVPLATLDAAVTRILQLIQRTARAREAGHTYDKEAHHALALRAAAEGAVLLKNEGGLLPVSPASYLAVIGAFAQVPRYQGAGSSELTPTRLEDALGALRARVAEAGGRLTYAPGYGRHEDRPDPALIAEACEAARHADAVLLFVGLPEAYETEGLDREYLRLAPAHDALVRAVAEVNPRVAVVLSNGAPVEMPWHAQVPAILEAYLGGQAGGGAVARVLLGDLEPGGRLAETFPLHLEDLPVSAMPKGPRVLEYRESLYVGYRYHDAAGTDVLFPFGHGLSYTTFAYADLALDAERLRDGDTLEVSVTVTNTGPRPGAEVVQVYVHAMAPGVFRPPQELKAFTKVRLAPGESRRVRLTLDRRAFAVWDAAQGGWAVEPGAYEVRVGSSSRDVRARAQAELTSEAPPALRDVPAVYRDVRAPGGFSHEAFAALYGAPLPENTREVPGAFTLNTPLMDMRASPVARFIHARMFAEASRVLGKAKKDISPVLRSMLEEASLRSLWLASQGLLRRPLLEALLSLSNGRYTRGALAILRAALTLGR